MKRLRRTYIVSLCLCATPLCLYTHRTLNSQGTHQPSSATSIYFRSTTAHLAVGTMPPACPLLDLPAELFQMIHAELPDIDQYMLSLTCRALHNSRPECFNVPLLGRMCTTGRDGRLVRVFGIYKIDQDAINKKDPFLCVSCLQDVGRETIVCRTCVSRVESLSEETFQI